MSRTLIATAALLVLPLLASADIAVKSGEKVAFLGDSITQGGWSSAKGYVKLVAAGLKANGVETEVVPAGISGHKSNQMLDRLEKDVLSKKPQWMTLSCGVNDVWHGAKGVPLEEYKKNIREIVDKCAAANVKVVILTATVIKEQLDSPENQKLAAYNDFLRELAKEKKLPVADLNSMFQERIKAANTPDKKVLTSDGVHMNDAGNEVMAEGVLRAFGVDDAGMAKAKEEWAK
jgi:lysophospholipase L1-like esterase